MNAKVIFRIFSYFALLGLAVLFPLSSGELKAQISGDFPDTRINYIQYNRLSFRNLEEESVEDEGLEAKKLKIEPLTMIEENVARNLNSHWTWPEYTLEMIDSYSPFLFRTKKSAALEEVKVLLQINSKGRLSGFEILGDVDNGLKERLDHMLRKLPDCKPVPGYAYYNPEVFELTIRK
ncbi:hypothetical protein JYB62_01460 [Algoriphagus lutimaris]|uniref:hypothetical protein n=1 Tax=Algoriphagus lutimaris TaxID=613197 RepID=UPI00196A3761|nr:hypothetical protein [Algoriphagus lutimaris]MBN3518653.1 hypothetical protein [Algoriphagus lutimaris]